MPARDKQKAPEGLVLRGETWHARKLVRVGSANVRIRETTGFARGEVGKAEAWLRRRVSEVERELLYGPAPEAIKPAVAGFATAAADYAERGGKRGPLGKQDIQKLETLGEFFGEKACDEIDEADWDDFVAARLAERKVPIMRDGKEIGKRAVAAAGPETERRWFAMFRAPLARELRRHGLALREFDIPPASAGHAPPFLHAKRQDELLGAYVGGARDVAEVLAETGCRMSEALRLRIERDIDLTARTLAFRITKNATPRVVPASPRALKALRRAIAKRSIGPVFLTPQGEAYNDRRAASHGTGLDGSGIRTAHRKACERIGLAGFRVHDWRHHAATWFMIRGGSETELMRLFGWKDRRMVQRYVDLPLEHLRRTLIGTKRAQSRAGAG